MPLLEGERNPSTLSGAGLAQTRRHSEQYSGLARAAIMSSANSSPQSESDPTGSENAPISHASLMPPPKTAFGRSAIHATTKPPPHIPSGLGVSLTDTPASTAPNSPQIFPRSAGSGSSTPSKIRATTLDIPGLTKSKASPDGRISERDVGAKLIIVMVGLPARGKSYIVKKIARYLNWLQHPTKIFNVGDRRRVAAGGGQTIPQPSVHGALRESVRNMSVTTGAPDGIIERKELLPPPTLAAHILVNGASEKSTPSPVSSLQTNGLSTQSSDDASAIPMPAPERLDQSAKFFDPDNKEAFLLREQVAHETLDDLLKYVLEDGGSVGILDATNHTQERRTSLMRHIRERDATINVLFLESRCEDPKLLEANMRLKLSGPDYRDRDPVKALEDFIARVEQYGRSYQTLGEHEEERRMSYCSMIDVGRKIISYQVQGFLSIQTVAYLMNFNLAPRQIWLTRHGQSTMNVSGHIGGDSSLSPAGVRYAKALSEFISQQRDAWEQHHIEKQASTHFPPRPGDTTPPNPEYAGQTEIDGQRNFCVWTSMLRRSIETAQFFNDDDFDVKQMRMLDELNAGSMEGMTYAEIKTKYHSEYELRMRDKLHYRYPGPGGEGYLDIINRLRKVILEVERMTDHVLIVGHRSITRVLLAYFKGLKQEDISDLDVPLGVLYMLEPRPYGVDFKVYRWSPESGKFSYEPNYQLRRARQSQA